MDYDCKRPHSAIIYARVKFILQYIMLYGSVKGKGVNTVLCYLLQKDVSAKTFCEHKGATAY